MKTISLFVASFLLLAGSLSFAADGIPNLNTSPASVLASAIRGVGPVKASAIVAGRPFKSLADVDEVKGIGPVTLGTIQALIEAGSLTLGAPSTSSAQNGSQTASEPRAPSVSAPTPNVSAQ